MSGVNFNVSRAEARLIEAIAERCLRLEAEAGRPVPERMLVEMDITACHANGNRLKLQELLDAAPADFNHDVWGIRQHIDRLTGKLIDCFSPRYSE